MQPQARLDFDLDVPDSFGYWFAGFVDGEGCFWAMIKERNYEYTFIEIVTAFQVRLRADDIKILSYIKKSLGDIGVLAYTRNITQTSKPAVTFSIRSLSEQKCIILPLFKKYPLKTKKANDFETWKEMVDIRFSIKHHARSENIMKQLQFLNQKLRTDRAYDENIMKQFKELE